MYLQWDCRTDRHAKLVFKAEANEKDVNSGVFELQVPSKDEF